MRILYLSLSYVPSRRASSVQVMRTCAAMARRGHQVILFTKRSAQRQESGVESDHAFYGVEPNFTIRKLARPARRGGGLIYILATLRQLWQQRRKADLVFSRDLAGAVLATLLGMRTAFESHGPPTGPLSRWMHRQLFASPHFCRHIVISEALRDIFAQQGLGPKDAARVLVAHDAADPPSQEASTEESGQALRVGYVGHLYAGRGIEVIVALAERTTEASFHLVGGAAADLQRWRGQALPDNLRFHGFVPPAQVAQLCRGFDVLLMPYQQRVAVASGRSDTSAWMSPMKMFEYMAAGQAIIASDLPVLREVLRHEDNALLVPPADADAWAQALRRLIADPDLRRQLGEQARSDLLQHYTWDARAQRVLGGLEEP